MATKTAPAKPKEAAKKTAPAKGKSAAAKPVKKAAPAKTKPAAAKKAAAKPQAKAVNKKGAKYSCAVCGLVVSVDTVCDCVDVCDLICCSKPMKVAKK